MTEEEIDALIQCYHRTRDSDDPWILERSDVIVDDITRKHGYKFPNFKKL